MPKTRSRETGVAGRRRRIHPAKRRSAARSITDTSPSWTQVHHRHHASRLRLLIRSVHGRSATECSRDGLSPVDRRRPRPRRRPPGLELGGHIRRSGSRRDTRLVDGAATAQSQLAAPIPGVDSKVAVIPVELEGGAHHVRATGAIPVLTGVDPARLISQLRLADGTVLGHSVRVDLKGIDLPPIPESGRDILDEASAQAELDRLGAEYNEQWSGGQPLDMAAFLCAIAQTELQDRALQHDVADLDIRSMLSGSYLAGWFSGRWFAENGYQRSAPQTLELGPPRRQPSRRCAREWRQQRGWTTTGCWRSSPTKAPSVSAAT